MVKKISVELTRFRGHVKGHAVGILHQLKCDEVLSQGLDVAGSPPG